MRAQVLIAARQWVGVRFRHQGRNLNGVDCKGLVERIALDLDLVDSAYEPIVDYPRFPDQAMLAAELDKWLDRVHGGVSAAWPADVLLMFDQKWASHLAILAHDTIIHATMRDRAVLEHTFDDEWRRAVRGVWRWRSLRSLSSAR